MNIFTLMILVALGYGIYKLFLAPKAVKPGQGQVVANPLVRCHRCGVWVPEKQSVAWEGKVYCSSGCRDQQG